MTIADSISSLRSRFGDAILAENEFRGEKTVQCNIEALRDLMQFCRDELKYDYLVDISSIDHFGDYPRYEMVYELYSMVHGIHLRLKATIPDEDNPSVPSVADLWPTADWHEREVYDMMGIRFDGHPDLRRILMWEGFPYYPLRKDFPLQGKPSDTPEVAFSDVAPLAGGPFVTVPTSGTTQVREPRARRAGDEPPHEKFIAEP
jgi:NADH-quinone oxidoreductase subunit C